MHTADDGAAAQAGRSGPGDAGRGAQAASRRDALGVSPEAAAVFPGDSETAAWCRTLDWSRTPLGPIAGWPQSLRTAISVMLASRFPMMIHWGPALTHFYNDGYAAILQGKHPGALGAPAIDWWPEIWDQIGPIFDAVRRGETTYFADTLVLPNRRGDVEECYFTFSHSPIRDETGAVGGIFVTAVETTPHVVSQRRLATLQALGARLSAADVRDAARVHAAAAAVLAANPHDVPFALLYRWEPDDTGAQLAFAVGVPPGSPLAPVSHPAGERMNTAAGWPLASVRYHAGAGVPVEGGVLVVPADRFAVAPDEVPGGPWPEPAREALVLPLQPVGGRQLGGLILGVSPRRPLDAEQRAFGQAVAEQIATALERVRLGVALSAERERLSALILQMPTPVALHEGPEHRHVLVNDAYKRVSGGGRDVTGLPVRETFPELDGSGIFDVFDRVYATGEGWSSPETLAPYDRDGTGVMDTWWNLRYEPVRDAGGAVTGVLTLAVDVTDQVLARREVERLLGESEARRAAEARFRAVQEAAPYGFGLHVPVRDREGRVVDFRIPYVNAAGAQLVGRTLAEIQAGTQRTLWPATADAVFADFLRALETGEPSYRELRSEHDGISVGLAITAVRIGTGDDAELAVSFEDISGRLRAEAERAQLLADAETARAAAEAERRRLAAVIAHLPVGVTFAEGPDGRHSVSNPAAVELWGALPASPEVAAYSREFTGFRPGSGAPGSAEENARRIASEEWPLARALATGEVVQHELVEIERADGTRRLVSLSAAPVRDADGRVEGALVTTVDVTERERLLAESQAARADAEAANRAKAEFLAVMSHELRTPLNAIGGYTELIELGIHGPVTDAQRSALARIQASQRHLLGLIAGVLDYSRVEAGAVAYRIVDVLVTEAVAEAETLVAPQLRAKGLGYTWSGAPPELRVRADREKLQQILLNLLGNAVKFTDARDGQRGRIEVACEVEERVEDAAGDQGARGTVRLHVRDTGHGIAPEQLERVFEPFVQADQRLTRPQQGVGLGLAISRDLARGMGGELTVVSVVGQGSTFTLALPHA